MDNGNNQIVLVLRALHPDYSRLFAIKYGLDDVVERLKLPDVSFKNK